MSSNSESVKMNEIDNSTERSLRPKKNQESEPWKQGRLLVVAIGINNYQYWQKLKNAVQDAVGFQQVLIDKLGFAAPIEPLINERATKVAVNNLVEDQLREILQEDDSLILFFAGHGYTRVDKLGSKTIETGYLIPVEASGSNKYSEYIEIDPFLKSVGKLPAKHILVILDSCHSGFALGSAMNLYRDAVNYTKDLSNKVSRRVITSALREQPALDSGPIPGHSLFTGTLINGFNWGEADLDGNGLISSSELGLFIQQKVGQASESKQTPDFGAFHWDDRGEMVISLRDQSFDALKARAFSALQQCEFSQFTELVNTITSIKPSHASSLYLQYRLKFLENDIKGATQILANFFNITSNISLDTLIMDIGGINGKNLQDTLFRLSDWWQILSIPECQSEFPIKINTFKGSDLDHFYNIEEKILGESKFYSVEFGQNFQFQLTNKLDVPIHVYLIEIDKDGCFQPITIWNDEDILLNGLQPQATKITYPFRQQNVKATSEFRFLVSNKRSRFLLFPCAPSTRGTGLVEFIDYNDLNQIFMKIIRISSIKSV